MDGCEEEVAMPWGRRRSELSTGVDVGRLLMPVDSKV
jgi:hypothetical protein